MSTESTIEAYMREAAARHWPLVAGVSVSAPAGALASARQVGTGLSVMTGSAKGMIERVLKGNLLAEWEAAGRPVNDQVERDRRAEICGACIDRKCAVCQTTEIWRWIPKQPCPLGLWTTKDSI